MQPQTTVPTRGGAKPGSGRPAGSKGAKALKKIAIKILEKIMLDEQASPDARAIAASKLIDEAKT